MAPHGETIASNTYTNSKAYIKPPRLSTINMSGLHRTFSDITSELIIKESEETTDSKLPPISEVENAKCECCGMSEECTPEYIERVRGKFLGKWICGLCTEAVKEELEKNGGKKEEALTSHMNACVNFNKFCRAYPVLKQAEAMRELLKKSNERGGLRAKSISPRDKKEGPKKGGLARSSSCIPALTKEINDLKISR